MKHLKDEGKTSCLHKLEVDVRMKLDIRISFWPYSQRFGVDAV